MTEIQFDAGTLLASDDDSLELTYALVPHGEKCRSNLGEFEVDFGAFTYPADLTGMSVNLDHDRTQPVASFSRLEDQADTLLATFKFASTDEGRAAYADAKSPTGKRRKVSVEARDIVIRAGKAVAGHVFGAALLEKGAFPSAVLLAAAADTEDDATSTSTYTRTASDGSEYSDSTTTTEETEDLGDGKKRITRTTVAVTEITEPDEPAKQEGTVLTATATPTKPTVAPTLLGRANAGPADEHEEEQPSGMNLSTLYAALAEAHRTKDPTILARLQEEGQSAAVLYAALSDIKATSTGGLTPAMLQPQWLGELWKGRDYQRRYIPLFSHGDLTGFTVEGFRWTTPPVVGAWSGNKTAVPSNPVAVESYSKDSSGLAGAHDIDRRFRDFSVPGFWESYFKHMTDSYSEESDQGALTDAIAAATAVVRGTVPTDMAPGMVSIVDGALAILDVAVPTFAIVAKDVWRQILLTPKDKTLEYLTSALSLEEGDLAGFKIVPARGTDLAAGKVLVGHSSAVKVFELPGSPIRVEGLDMVKGGIDPGLFGYYNAVIENEDALALVSPPA